MAILALYSQKGGVGKTAAAVNLAYEAAQSGLRVLLCDLDPQGAASFFFRVKPRLKRKARGLAKAHRAIAASIKATDYPGLNLLPADFSHRNLDLVLGDRKKPARRLRRTFKPLEKEHDLILLDCPPTMSLFAENILTVADAVLVPLVPTTLSLRSHRQLLAFAHDSLQKPAPSTPSSRWSKDAGSSTARSRQPSKRAMRPCSRPAYPTGVWWSVWASSASRWPASHRDQMQLGPTAPCGRKSATRSWKMSPPTPGIRSDRSRPRRTQPPAATISARWTRRHPDRREAISNASSAVVTASSASAGTCRSNPLGAPGDEHAALPSSRASSATRFPFGSARCCPLLSRP